MEQLQELSPELQLPRKGRKGIFAAVPSSQIRLIPRIPWLGWNIPWAQKIHTEFLTGFSLDLFKMGIQSSPTPPALLPQPGLLLIPADFVSRKFGSWEGAKQGIGLIREFPANPEKPLEFEAQLSMLPGSQHIQVFPLSRRIPRSKHRE